MKRLEEDLRVAGRNLKRYLFLPDPETPVRACAMHFHGQGDYASRYDEVLVPFTRHGVACIATDLPGHGRSRGIRGRVPGFEVVDEITRANEARLRELCPDGPLGVLGHSAGGLMGLRALLARPSAYAFSWISSPLILPEANQNRFLVWALPVVAALVPWLTVSTGVQPDDCRHTDPEEDEGTAEGEDVLFHTRVSIGWGRDMINAAAKVRARLVSTPPTLPLLLTQGSADEVCPAQHLRDALAPASLPNLRYKEFEGALHEPFADDGKKEVFAVISAWLDEVLGKAPQTSPSG